jgi:hypothetical protein
MTLTPTTVTIRVELIWRGQTIKIPFTETVANTSIPQWEVLGPLSNPGGATADVKHPVESEVIDLAKEYPGLGGKIGWRNVQRPVDEPVLAEYIVDFNQLFGARENAVAYALTWIDADEAQDAVLALGSDDGVVVWLNDKQVHQNLTARSYVSQSDRIGIHLNQGHNKLLVKITQGGGGWSFCAHLLKPDGTFVPGVKYLLDP